MRKRAGECGIKERKCTNRTTPTERVVVDVSFIPLEMRIESIM
jgi:hypothetical protein